jgi:hypothetical protein
MVRRWRLIGYFPILYNPLLTLSLSHTLSPSLSQFLRELPAHHNAVTIKLGAAPGHQTLSVQDTGSTNHGPHRRSPSCPVRAATQVAKVERHERGLSTRCFHNSPVTSLSLSLTLSPTISYTTLSPTLPLSLSLSTHALSLSLSVGVAAHLVGECPGGGGGARAAHFGLTRGRACHRSDANAMAARCVPLVLLKVP